MKTAILPYDLCVTAEAQVRYTDPRFRRVARYYHPYKLEAITAVELVAFLELVPFQFARWIFRWKPYYAKLVAITTAHEPYRIAAQPMIEANLHALSAEAGLRILQAMREGGWTNGRRVPKVVRDAICELRAQGHSAAEVSRMSGIGYNTVLDWTGRRAQRAKRKATAASRGAVALAI